MMQGPVPVLGYRSKGAAAVALRAQGKSDDEIAALIGSSAKSVSALLRIEDRRGGAMQPADVMRARRLFAKTMLYIAEALGVTPEQLATQGLKGCVSLGRVNLIRERLLDMAGEGEGSGAPQGTSEVNSSASVNEPLVTVASDANVEAGDDDLAQQNGGALPDGGAAAAAPLPVDEPTEPSREDDEAELARLAAEAGDDDDDEGGESDSTAVPAFILRNANGEHLNARGRGFTRISKFFWRGTAADIAALRRSNPEHRELKAIPAGVIWR